MSKTVKMKHETASSFSFDGELYTADKKGVFEIAAGEAAAAAVAYGFEHVTGKETTSPKAEGSEAKDGGEGA